ncbi:MAG: ADOP family duplicated permease [Gemmatimonadaceae bacterium]
MALLGRMARRLAALTRRKRAERGLEVELRFHLEMEIEKNIRSGLSPADARRAALVAFGGVEKFKEECRDARGTRPMERLAQDMRYALRRVAKQPGFSVPAILTLAVGLGVTTAIFALVHGVLLQSLPYWDPGRLVVVRHTAPGLGIGEGGQSEGTYLHYRKHNRAFEELGVYLDRELSITDDRNDPERIMAALVTPSVLAVLRATPLRGRLFAAADVEYDSALTVIISHDLWVRRYGADPGIVGRRIELNRVRRQVVGIMPPGFEFPRPDTKVWYAWPVEATRAGIGVHDMHYTGIARLRSGVTPDDAERDLRRMIRSLPDAYPDAAPQVLERAQLQPIVVRLKDAVVADVRPALLLLLCAAVFVLLIVCANVANLFLVRAERLRKEVAVERALGAAGSDLARRFLAESLLVASIGAALGLVLALAVIGWRLGFEPGQIPRLHEVRLGGTVLVVTVGLALLSSLLLGLVSLARAGRPELTTALKGTLGHMTAGRESQVAQRFLVGLQVALALTLLIGSAAMAQSFWKLKRFDIGFEPTDVLTLELPLPARPYTTYQRSAGFFIDLLSRIRAVPGVMAAEAAGGALPLAPLPSYLIEPLAAEIQPAGSREEHLAAATTVTPGYFGAMGIPLTRGRTFQPGDLRSETPAVIVSAALARTLFGGVDPIGRRVRFARLKRYPWYTVVGVAGDVPGEAIPAGPLKTLYLPVLDDLRATPQADAPLPYYPSEMTVVVRTSLPPTSLIPAVRRIVRELDPKVPIAHIRTAEQVLAASMSHTRLTMLLLLTAAATALFLGVVGLYGVVSYSVSRRTREFGVRIALGARPTDVNRMVVRQGASVTLAGIIAGLLSAFLLTRFLRGLLFEVSPSDPATFAATSVLLLMIAALASYLPARRAASVDPIQALRAE